MAKTSYNDSALGERPPVTATVGGGTAGDKNPSAKGRPSISQSDGTENMRADQKTKMAARLSTPKGSKSFPKGVDQFGGGSV